MPEPETDDNLPFEPSSIAAIGKRRGWFSTFFGKGAAPVNGGGPEESEERITHSMLGSLASAAGPEPLPKEEPSRSL
ncbi:MAG: hypothetical protein WAU32_14595, partial [Thermoanaerobaculia bacterium]